MITLGVLPNTNPDATRVEMTTIHDANGNPKTIFRVRTGGIITSVHDSRDDAFIACGWSII